MADEAHAPESSTATTAGEDDLARGLPGLPFETKRLRADERGVLRKRGFLRREELVPWSEVVGHRRRALGLALERQRPDECEVHPVPVRAGRAARRRIDAAWREYVLRRVERDGLLRGTHSLRCADARGALAIALGVVLAGIFGLLLFVPDRFEVQESIACLLFLAASVSFLVAGFRERRLVREAVMHWYRWELGREGFVHWPFMERTVLRPEAGDAIGSGWARVGGAIAPLAHLTFSRAVSPVVLAMLERGQARRPLLGWLGLREAALSFMPWIGGLILAAVAFALAYLLVSWEPPEWAGALFLCAFWAMMAAVFVESKLRTRRAVADGRAMLARLGW